MNILEPMKTVCAWCRKLISGDPDARKISHGICSSCEKKINDEMDSKNALSGKEVSL